MREENEHNITLQHIQDTQCISVLQQIQLEVTRKTQLDTGKWQNKEKQWLAEKERLLQHIDQQEQAIRRQAGRDDHKSFET